MRVRLLACSVGVALVAVLAVPPAGGYIHFPPTTLQKMCKQSVAIRVLKVKQHSREQGVIIFEATETLKGKTPEGKSFRHVIGKEAKEKNPIFDWVADVAALRTKNAVRIDDAFQKLEGGFFIVEMAGGKD